MKETGKIKSRDPTRTFLSIKQSVSPINQSTEGGSIDDSTGNARLPHHESTEEKKIVRLIAIPFVFCVFSVFFELLLIYSK